MEEVTHTSRAALRPGKAAVVKISAGLYCEAESPLGSVETVPRRRPQRERRRSDLARLRLCCRFLHVPSVGRGRNRRIDTAHRPRKLPTHASKWQSHFWETCVWHRSSIFVTCCQAPLMRSVFFKRLRRDRSVSRESWPWSCDVPSRLFRGAQKSISSLSLSCKAGLGCSRDATVGFETLGKLRLRPEPPAERTASAWLDLRHQGR